MKNSKITRLMFGLVILFSFFIFQGSHDEDGCAQCENQSLGGELVVINNVLGSYILKVKAIPSSGSKLIYPGESVSFYLDKGTYHVIAFEVDLELHITRVVQTNMITMDTLSKKTIVVE